MMCCPSGQRWQSYVNALVELKRMSASLLAMVRESFGAGTTSTRKCETWTYFHH